MENFSLSREPSPPISPDVSPEIFPQIDKCTHDNTKEPINIQEETDELDKSFTPRNNDKKLQAPHVGIMFDTIEEARIYYESYGQQEGFWTRVRSLCKGRSRSDQVTSIIFVCSHQGNYVFKDPNENTTILDDKENGEEKKKKRKRTCSTVKGGCEATLRIRHKKWSNKYEVYGFNDNHNHKIVTPIRRIQMPSNRQMPKAARALTEAFQKENLQISKVPSILGGEHIGFNSRDCYNHLKNVRHRDLEGGDAQCVLTYFRRKQSENPQFFYAIQCDENGRATNFFWVDARSRMSYRYFGDVVTFDTTYRTNKYDMSFAPFTGVNHHFQSIQFGCALLQDESEVNFIWLFETWLEAIGGHYPISIITDQDLAMKGAIAKVEIKKCIWSMRKIDFERRWKTLMIKHELQKNTWLEHLYEIRASWVPVYNWDTFYAGMNTTGRSESINSFCDAFVTSQTNLREFVVKYEQALKKIVTSESNEDFESEHKYRIVKDIEFLLKHASTLYTRNVFKKFKYEWDQVNHYRVEEVECENECTTYLLEPKVGEFERVVVKFNLHTHEGSCECQKFEFLGIPCRHILKLLVRLDIDKIPAHFILPRWLQGANKFRVMDATLDNDNNENSEALRLSHMCQESSKLACYASSSYEKYKMYMETLKELSKRLESFKDKDVTNLSTNIPEDTNAPNDMETQSTQAFSRLFLLDPNISQTKGRNKDTKSGANGKGSGRMKGGFELAMEKRKRKCQLRLKSAGHDKRNCPLNTKKGNKRLMESESEETDDAQYESNTDTDQD